MKRVFEAFDLKYKCWLPPIAPVVLITSYVYASQGQMSSDYKGQATPATQVVAVYPTQKGAVLRDLLLGDLICNGSK